MVRFRLSQEVRYGHFPEFYEMAEELNKVIKAKGLAQFRMWTPTAGKMNQVIWEFDYPDLATLDKEGRTFSTDADCMKVFRRSGEVVVQGTSYSEILEEAYEIA